MKKFLFNLVNTEDTSIVVQLIKMFLLESNDIEITINTKADFKSTFFKEDKVEFKTLSHEEIIKELSDYDFVITYKDDKNFYVFPDDAYLTSQLTFKPNGELFLIAGFGEKLFTKDSFILALEALDNLNRSYFHANDFKIATTSELQQANHTKIDLVNLFDGDYNAVIFDPLKGKWLLENLTLAKKSSLDYIGQKNNKNGSLTKFGAFNFMGMYKKTDIGNYLEDYFFPFQIASNKKTNIFFLNADISFDDLEALLINLKN